jgi:uncharacterized protein (TIGR02588 family)
MAEGAEDRHQAPEADRRDDADEARLTGDRDQAAPPPWEWGVAFLGLVLVLAALGFVAYQAVAGDDSPPYVTVHAEAILPLDHGYLVQLRAVNQGGSTAAQVVVEGRLTGESGRLEMGEAVIDYVPSHSHRKGGLFFSQDPRKHPLQLRARGYAEP